MTKPAPLPDLVLYDREGCHLCEETHALLLRLLAERAAAGLPAPRLVRRDIEADPATSLALSEVVPVLELAGRRLPLAIRVPAIRAFLAGGLDDAALAGDPASPDGTVPGRG